VKCLVVSHVFPNRLDPWRGPYNRQQVAQLARLCEVRVVNPVPWTQAVRRPSLLRVVGGGGGGLLEGVSLAHPLHCYAPGVGRGLMAWALLRLLRRAARKPGGVPDVVYSTWAFPHGHAAVRLGRELGAASVVELRGSDVNDLPARGALRRLTATALRGADAVVAVSAELAGKAVQLGSAPQRTHVVRNGVDRSRFRPAERGAARAELGLDGDEPLVVFAGNLLEVKRPDVLLEAFARLRAPARLAVLGSGPLLGRLRRTAGGLGAAERVRFVGHVPYPEMPTWMNAADVLCLPSRSEGCPTVVLEALACGTPVVASEVGAVRELLGQEGGLTVPPGDAGALAAALDEALGRDWDRDRVCGRVEGLTWADNARRLYAIMCDAVAARRRSHSHVTGGQQ